MAVLDIVLYPNPVLSTPAEPVARVDDAIRRLVDDMADTMYAAPGVGLAAPQVGRGVRVLVCDVTNPNEGEEPVLHALINPVIIERSGNITWEEGCLSMPGLYRDVKRAAHIVVEALDRNGDTFRLEAEELLAVCIQHEMDHLDGVMFVDRLSTLKKRLALKEWRRLRDRLLATGEEDEAADATAP